MKRLSIKLKITLYITLILSAFAVAMMMITVNFARTSSVHQLKDTLREEVNSLYGGFKFVSAKEEKLPPEGQRPPEGELPPEGQGAFNGYGGGDKDKAPRKFTLTVPADAKYENRGVDLFVWADLSNEVNTENICFTKGALPAELKFDTAWKTDKIFELNGYYVFVRFIEDPIISKKGIWVCGAIDTSDTRTAAYNTTRLTLIQIPFVILLAAVLSYFVSKHTFKPVAKITEAAATIAASNDLSQRLNMGEGKDELSTLASTFDGMLDTIERNFEKEKQFTADASHELRTPVAVIMAQSEFALDPKATKEDRTEALNSINRQSKKMNKLLSELLNLARADNKVEALEKESFDICELAEMVLAENDAYAKEKNISLSLETKEAVFVRADQTQIMRVLINLISNAVKYGKEGGTVSVSVEDKGDGHILCKVIDDGIGISPEDLKCIWNRFFRADSARSSDSGSIGLGLPMVKSIIETHGGTVSAESVLGEGSVFSFYI
ncbi:MAG: HAMP domain-containing histidine kinase [Ruminococcaceae bacterium]|nr:HAMP domain-containing histidine kinase [Oscillospiraceae bacterium]